MGDRHRGQGREGLPEAGADGDPVLIHHSMGFPSPEVTRNPRACRRLGLVVRSRLRDAVSLAPSCRQKPGQEPSPQPLRRILLCPRNGCGGAPLAAAGSVRSEHWKRTPTPLAHSAKARPPLELTCERRTVPAEPPQVPHSQRQRRHAPPPPPHVSVKLVHFPVKRAHRVLRTTARHRAEHHKQQHNLRAQQIRIQQQHIQLTKGRLPLTNCNLDLLSLLRRWSLNPN